MSGNMEWWHRASTALADARFRREFRQVHGLASLTEYAPNPSRARRAIPFSFQADKLYETAIQIFIAASLEVRNGTSLSDSGVNEAFRMVGQLLYFLDVGERDHFQQQDLLIRAALAFDLAGYSANSYVALALRSVIHGLPTTSYPTPDLVVDLYLSRRMAELRRLTRRWQQSTDSSSDAPHFNGAYLEALSSLNNFLLNGGLERYEEAKARATEVARLELDSGTTSNWYLARGFELAVQRLRHTSIWLRLADLRAQLSPLWRSYVRSLALGTGDRVFSPIVGEAVRTRPVIELWPSQLDALDGGLLTDNIADHVIKMPTSAGKTRLAEFAIIDLLTDQPAALCIYVVPYIALANEVKRSLRNSLGRVGIRVTDLFQGEYELTSLEQELLERNDVVICTPEKLDLVIRRKPELLKQAGLFIFDESHVIDQSARGVRYEFLIERLRQYRKRTEATYRILLMSAVIPNAEDLAVWLAGSRAGLLESDWRPTAVRMGVFHWRNGGQRGDINYAGERREGEEYYVPGVLRREVVRTRYYPSGKSQVCAELARALVNSGPVVIFASTKRNVGGVVTAIQKALGRAKVSLPIPKAEEHQRRLRMTLRVCSDYLGDDHELVTAIRSGFAYHTGDVPQSIRTLVEELFERGTIKLLVCTNTLAQGVNLPVKSLVVHSLVRGKANERISSRDFMNIAGRAARALREMEGQIIFVHDGPTATFLRAEKEVQDVKRLEAQVLSSIMLLYAHLAKVRGELALDADARRFLESLAATRHLTEDNAEDLDEGLAALDSQLLALLVEESQGQLLDAATNLAGSLFDVQAHKHGVNPAPIYGDLTRRFIDIGEALKDDITRQRFFRTALSRSSCSELIAASSRFLELLENAPASLEEAKDLIHSAFDASIQARETKPRKDAAAISDLFDLFWQWLNGTPVSEVRHDNDVSAELLARTIEDLFARKVPWGLNSMFILSEDAIAAKMDPLPVYLRHLPALARFGVPTPAAAMCRAIGVSDRRSSILLAEAYSQNMDRFDPDAILDWLAGLSMNEVLEILKDPESATQVFGEIQAAQLGNPGASNVLENEWKDVEVRGLSRYATAEIIKALRVGDDLQLVREPENPADSNAIRVLASVSLEMIGYIAADYARIVAPLMDEGIQVRSTLSKLGPGTPGYPYGRLYVSIAA